MRNLSVVIPSRTTSNFEVSAVAVLKHEPSARLILVDDGHVGPDLLLRAEFDEIAIVAGAKPFIFARNMNLGITAAGDDDVVLLNDDAILETPGGFTLLQQAAEDNPSYGIIGATTNVTGQPLQFRQQVGLREVPHFAFVCVLIPRRTLDKVGLLDERYSIDYGVEDRDYCEAVRRADLKNGVHDFCYVDHGSLRSSFRGDPRRPLSFAKNYELFLQKWGLPA